MSPAAVDFRSATTSPQQKPAFSQNPNPNFAAFSAENFTENQRTMNSSYPGCGNVGDFDMRSAFALPNEPRIGSTRSRPRLVKVRKQLNGRSRTVSSENGSGFNPFRSASESSGQVSSNYCTSNGVLESSSGTGVSNGSEVANGTAGFDIAQQLNYRERKFDGSVGRLNVDDRDRNEIENKEESGKFESVGFVFSAQPNGVQVKLDSEKRQSHENVENSASADMGKLKTECIFETGKFDDAGFASRSNETNMERGERSERAVNLSSADGLEAKLETKAECRKDIDVGFTFGASINGLRADSKSSLEEEEVSQSLQKQGSEFVGFVFSTNQSDLASTSDSGTSYSSSVVGKQKTANLNFNFSRQGCCNKDHCNDVFIFGGKSKESFSSECMAGKRSGETKANSRTLGNLNNKAQSGNLDADLNNESEVVSESSGSVFSSSSTNLLFLLPDKLKKLNINDFENVEFACKNRNSNKNLSAKVETTFVFNSSRKVSEPYSASSETTSDNEILEGCAAAAVERSLRDNIRTGHDIQTSSDGNCNASNLSAKNSCSEPFIFHAAELEKSRDIGKLPKFQQNNDVHLNAAAKPFSFSSFGFGSSPNTSVFREPSAVGVEKKVRHGSRCTSDGEWVPSMNFCAPQWDPSCFKSTLFPQFNKDSEFSVNNRSLKDKKLKRARRKLKQSTLCKLKEEQDHVARSSHQENLNSPVSYSPMDFSPYHETASADQLSEGTSTAAKGSSQLYNSNTSSATLSSVTTGGVDVKGEQDHKEANDASCGYHWQGCSVGDCPQGLFSMGAETACSGFKSTEACSSSSAAVASTEDVSNIERQQSNPLVQLCFTSGFQDKIKFTFSAASSGQGSLSRTNRQHRKKNKAKVGSNTFIITPRPNIEADTSSAPFPPSANTSSLSDPIKHQEVSSTSRIRKWKKSEADESVKQGSTSSSIQDACEQWRLRGNKAYKDGNLSKAEDFYTQGINSVPSSESLGCCVKPLVLCYSNRAATRVSLGRMREAIGDCAMAAKLDPNFHKVHVRAANCHLVLGEVEDAVQYFNKCLGSGADVCLDRRVTIEAADGLQKAQKVANCTNLATKLLGERTSDAAVNALEIIAEALSISSCSEQLLEMKAEALFLCRKYEEAIQLCEQTLHIAEKNFATDNKVVNKESFGRESYLLAKLWRWRLIAKSFFFVGKLEMALDLLEKLEQEGPIRDKRGVEILESSISLAVTVRELLRRKNAGNEAVQSRRYAEAVDHYSVALSSNIESRPFVAICFCNRAAAYQALGQVADSIADCSVAMALDGNYAKAVSRRAALHEMIRDYGQAANDLQRLVSILENQSNEKGKKSDTPSRSTGNNKELRQAYRHMSSMEEAAKKDIPLDFYLILGIKPSDTAADVKKAYRKAALRHHPDKAGQFLARSESGTEGRFWKEIAEEVHKDADRLFKMIGEAYAVLSDTAKKSEYDLEEEIRTSRKESYGKSPYGRSSDVHSYPFERNASRRNWQDNWNTYSKSHYRW